MTNDVFHEGVELNSAVVPLTVATNPCNGFSPLHCHHIDCDPTTNNGNDTELNSAVAHIPIVVNQRNESSLTAYINGPVHDSDDESDRLVLHSSESEDPDDFAFGWDIHDVDDTDITHDHSQIETNCKKSLADWVVECNIPRSHVNNLLKRLNNDAGLKYLPHDWRTLMSSKRGRVDVIDMPPGKYHHLQIEPALYAILVAMESKCLPIPDEMLIFFNVDGLPLTNSSSSEFWPILCKVLGWDDVIVAGIYHGAKKPKNINAFLANFKEEIVKLKVGGIEFRDKIVRVTLSGLCSDAPATSFALNIAPHNAYYACRKCTTKGLWVSNHSQQKTAGRVTYPELDAPLRTDISFRGRLQIQHHSKDNNRSIVEDILTDMVEDVCLDYMHVVCIGVYKKQLK